MIIALFADIYKALPDVTIEWRDMALGAAVTSLWITTDRTGEARAPGSAAYILFSNTATCAAAHH